MRRTIVFLFLLVCAFNVNAYEAGDVSLGVAAVYSPLALGTDFGEVNVEDHQAATCHDAKLGKPGMGGELQALYFLNPRLGIGLSFADQYFSKDLSSGWQLNTHTRLRNYMAVGHFLLTPQSTWEVYIPFGAGLAQTNFAVDFSNLGDGMNHFKYNGFAYYVGIGAERALSERVSLGLEARYNGNRFHASSTRANGDHVTVYPQANFFSLLVRLIYKI